MVVCAGAPVLLQGDHVVQDESGAIHRTMVRRHPQAGTESQPGDFLTAFRTIELSR